ncbi:MAG: hypothetical protein WBQ95_03995, partial [Terracidiphilus sp.]
MTGSTVGRTKLRLAIVLVLLETFAGALLIQAQESHRAGAPPNPMPAIVQKDGHFALMVDGEPYLMLGVQANNSSAWPDYLDKVWPAAETLHANTVELPVYW